MNEQEINREIHRIVGGSGIGWTGVRTLVTRAVAEAVKECEGKRRGLLDDCERWVQRVESLKASTAALNEKLDAAEKKRLELVGDCKSWFMKCDKLEADLSLERSKIAALTRSRIDDIPVLEKLRSAEAERDSWEALWKSTQKLVDRAQDKCDALRAELATLRAEKSGTGKAMECQAIDMDKTRSKSLTPLEHSILHRLERLELDNEAARNRLDKHWDAITQLESLLKGGA